jgi:hypothetical protein
LKFILLVAPSQLEFQGSATFLADDAGKNFRHHVVGTHTSPQRIDGRSAALNANKWSGTKQQSLRFSMRSDYALMSAATEVDE